MKGDKPVERSLWQEYVAAFATSIDILREFPQARDFLGQPDAAAATAWLERRTKPREPFVEWLVRTTDQALERHNPAAPHFADRALLAARRFGTPHQLARALTNRAVIGLLAAEFDGTAEQLSEAARLFAQVDDVGGEARARRMEGYRGWRMRDLDTAEGGFRAAEALYRRADGGQPGLADCWRMLGMVAEHRKDRPTALRLMHDAANLFAAARDFNGLAQAWQNIAAVSLRSGDLDTAEHYLDLARTYYAERREPAGLAQVGILDGCLAIARGQPASEQAFTAFAELFGSLAGEHLRAQGLWLRSIAVLGEPDAVRHLMAAYHVFAPGRRVRYPLEAANTLSTWSAHCFGHGRPYAAWLRASAAIRLYDRFRDEQATLVDRDVYRRDTAMPTAIAVMSGLLLADAAEREHPDDAQRWRFRAWQTSEAHKSGLLRSLLSGDELRSLWRRAAEDDPAMRELIARLERVADRLRALNAALGVDRLDGLSGSMVAASSAAANARRREIEALEGEKERLERQIDERLQRLGGLLSRTAAVPTERLLALLEQEQAAMVCYALLPGDEFVAFVLGPDGSITHVPLPPCADGAPLTDDRVYAMLVEPTSEDHQLASPWHSWTSRRDRAFRDLGRVLWEPLEAAGLLAAVRHVYVVPDGWLRVLPFAALPVDGETGSLVADRAYSLSVLLAASLLPDLVPRADEPGAARPGLATVLDPTRDIHPAWPVSGPERLTDADADEAGRRSFEHALAELRLHATPDLLLEGQVDRAAFGALVSRANGVIYLGHGREDGLVLRDGPLAPYDVLRGVRTRGPAVLGACLLGLGHAKRGLAGASTIHALHAVGCGAVIGALWTVPAAPTARLLALLQADGGQGDGGWAGALQRAVHTLRTEPTPTGGTLMDGRPWLSDDPSVWAAFVCFGHSHA